MQECFGDVAGVVIGETRVNHLLQADDLVLMSETRTGLQSLLNRLELYCRSKKTLFQFGTETNKNISSYLKISASHRPESWAMYNIYNMVKCKKKKKKNSLK